MGTTMKCHLLFKGIMWSAPGWWKLMPIRPVEEDKKRKDFTKGGKTWKLLIKATLLTDIHFNLPLYCQQWGNASHDEMFNMKWINNTFTQRDTTAENRCEKQGRNTHSFVGTHCICTHTHTNKGSYKARNSIVCAFCYDDNVCMLQGPICQRFHGETGGVGRLNGSLGYLRLSLSTSTTNNKNTLKPRQK